MAKIILKTAKRPSTVSREVIRKAVVTAYSSAGVPSAGKVTVMVTKKSPGRKATSKRA